MIKEEEELTNVSDGENESIKIKEMVLKAQRYTATFAGYQWNWNIECRKWGKENAGRI